MRTKKRSLYGIDGNGYASSWGIPFLIETFPRKKEQHLPRTTSCLSGSSPVPFRPLAQLFGGGSSLWGQYDTMGHIIREEMAEPGRAEQAQCPHPWFPSPLQVDPDLAQQQTIDGARSTSL